MKNIIQYPFIIKTTLYFFIPIFLLYNLFCFAVNNKPDPEFKTKLINNKIYLYIDLSGGYKIYGPLVPSNIGSPTIITFAEQKNIKSIKPLWPNLNFSKNENFYTGPLSIPIEILPANINQEIFLRTHINYLLCNEQCIPKFQSFENRLLINPNDEALIHNNSDHQTSKSILLIIAFAVIGGFILNFMPCVLPVLTLKLLSLQKDKKANHFIFTIAGILITFTSFGIITIFLKKAGKQIGLGLNFQYPEFIIALTILITFFISLVLDRITLQLPAAINKFLNNSTFKSIHLEYFASGILASILSTPCTAPFLGTAMALALTSSPFIILITFFSVGLGFSTPYILLVTFPSLLNFLPKPGKWLATVKYFLCLLLILTLIWLCNILSSQLGLKAGCGLFLLLIIIKYIIENFKSFEKKVLYLCILIPFCFYLPNFAYHEKQNQDQQISSVWQEFKPEIIENYIKEGKVVVVDVTAEWCVTCKYNKVMVLDQIHTLKLLQDEGIIAMRADFTNKDENIYNYLVQNNNFGIPFNVVYGPYPPYKIILPVLLSYNDLKIAINKLKGDN